MSTHDPVTSPYEPGPLVVVCPDCVYATGTCKRCLGAGRVEETTWDVAVEIRVRLLVFGIDRTTAYAAAKQRATRLLDIISLEQDVDPSPDTMNWSTYDAQEVTP